MEAAQRGLRINVGAIYSSRVPTSRELVNMVGAGLNTLYIGDPAACRDEYGVLGMKQLKESGIIKLTTEA